MDIFNVYVSKDAIVLALLVSAAAFHFGSCGWGKCDDRDRQIIPGVLYAKRPLPALAGAVFGVAVPVLLAVYAFCCLR